VKKIVAKKCEKNFFLYSQEYRDKKIGGKKREAIIPETQQIVRSNNVWKKIVAKFAKYRFYLNTNVVTKKWWKKMRETIIPETHQ